MLHISTQKFIPITCIIIYTVLVNVSGISAKEEELVSEQRSFEIDYDSNSFLKDGKPFRYVSGSIHYFRSPEERWDSILKKFRLAGLNALTTYIAWNMHQPNPSSEFNFDGNLNIFKFLELAQQNDLLVILRPGPYMDAERDMGGLPAWLLWQKPGIKIRTSDLEYNYFVSRWFDVLLPKLQPFLYQNGGPIIMMQVENEYGSFGCDKTYPTFLRDLLRFHLGNELVLFSTDGAGEGYVKCGSVPGVYPTVDFGPENAISVENAFVIQRKFAPKGPLINSEYYPGWLDHWQKPHSTVSVNATASTLNEMLALGANVNIYMFHGGTSFGYGAGANIDGNTYDPCPTSYDYDAPLNEAGDPTDKYFAIKDVISSYLPVPSEDPKVLPKANYGKITLKPFTGMFDHEFLTLFGGSPSTSSPPASFEQLKIASGFVLYQTTVDFITSDPILFQAPGLKDRGYIYVDMNFVGILSRSEHIFSLPLMIRKGQTISVLVENQGRVCFGSEIGESKGIGENITLGTTHLKAWTIFPFGEFDGKKLTKYSLGLKDDAVAFLKSGSGAVSYLRNQGSGNFFVGNLSLPESQDPISDTFIRLDGFTKGVVWVNGFNLGRYWPVVGPQETLYLPGPFLRPAPYTNTFIVFELEKAPSDCITGKTDDDSNNCYLTLTDTHVINGKTPYDKQTFTMYRKHHGSKIEL